MGLHFDSSFVSRSPRQLQTFNSFAFRTPCRTLCSQACPPALTLSGRRRSAPSCETTAFIGESATLSTHSEILFTQHTQLERIFNCFAWFSLMCFLYSLKSIFMYFFLHSRYNVVSLTITVIYLQCTKNYPNIDRNFSDLPSRIFIFIIVSQIVQIVEHHEKADTKIFFFYNETNLFKYIESSNPVPNILSVFVSGFIFVLHRPSF